MISRHEFDLLMPPQGNGGGNGGGKPEKDVIAWPPPSGSGNGNSDGESQEDIDKRIAEQPSGSREGDGDGAEKGKEGELKPGAGAGEEGKGTGKGKNDKSYSVDKIENTNLGVGGVITEEEGKTMQEALGVTPTKLSREQVEKITKQAANEIPETAGKQAGNQAGLLKRRIAELYTPQVDWKAALKTFVGRALSPHSTERITDRRHPGLFTTQERRKENALNKVVCAVDTSGSMGDEELAIILTEIKAIVEQKKVKHTILVYFDTIINGVVRLSGPGAVKRYTVKKEDDVIGGGGTNFLPPLQEMTDIAKKEQFGCAIFLTDGYADLKLPKPKFAQKFIWVIIDNPTFQAPWGLKTIHITKKQLKDIQDKI